MEEGKEELTPISLLDLSKDKIVMTKVISMMKQHKSYDRIISFLKSKNYKIAKGTLTNLKNKIIEADETGVPLESLLDKRKKNSVNQVDETRISGFTGDTDMEDAAQQVIEEINGPKPIYSTRQVYEMILQKGVNTLVNSEAVDLPVLLRVLELLDRYHKDETNGLTTEALKQYQLINRAQDMALQEVFMSYVPKEKQADALEAMEKRSTELLKELGVSEEGRKLLRELKNSGIDVG